MIFLKNYSVYAIGFQSLVKSVKNTITYCLSDMEFIEEGRVCCLRNHKKLIDSSWLIIILKRVFGDCKSQEKRVIGW